MKRFQMSAGGFFDEQEEQSAVKATIVAKYFWAWARVLLPSIKKRGGKIGYIDLFAGPGRYKDGSKSTPLLVLERAIQDGDLAGRLVTHFNDKDEHHVRELDREIDALPGIARLKHKPKVHSEEVGDKIVAMFSEHSAIPTLFFIDPWGYKGLSLRLINSVLKDWGSECIVFFNYNRVSMGLANDAVREHMDSIFGGERAARLRERVASLDPTERELAIVEELATALKEMGARFVLPFRFMNDVGTRTTHHLVFASKHAKGYQIMKEIMAAESTKHEQGVASFEYNATDQRFPLLFELSRPLDTLERRLLDRFAGQRLTTLEIFEKDNVDTPYIMRNYQDALRSLESQARITTEPPANRRRRQKGVITFGEKVMVQFPALTPT